MHRNDAVRGTLGPTIADAARFDLRPDEARSSAERSGRERDERSPLRTSTLRFHRVAPGETLTDIAEAYYGDETFWILLYGNNEATMRKAGGLRPGLILYIPFISERFRACMIEPPNEA